MSAAAAETAAADDVLFILEKVMGVQGWEIWRMVERVLPYREACRQMSEEIAAVGWPSL